MTILMSIHKEYSDLILCGKKRAEVRPNFPVDPGEMPLRILLYEAKNGGGCGMIVGEFACDGVARLNIFRRDLYVPTAMRERLEHCRAVYARAACISVGKLMRYAMSGRSRKKDKLCFWHVTAPRRYDTPVDYKTVYDHKTPPQSWAIVAR